LEWALSSSSFSGERVDSSMTTKILLADDHKIVRDGLRMLFENEKGLEVIGEAGNGWETLKMTHKLVPDIVIMDITMPGLNGIDTTQRITNELPGVKVIALSMHSDRRFVSGMLEAGASGYLLKDCAMEELAAAVRAVSLNQTYLSPRIADIVVKNYINKAGRNKSELFPSLTNREREILQLLAEGKSARQIAGFLHVSIKTVETHRRNIMFKLDLGSTAELIKYAINEGLIVLES